RADLRVAAGAAEKEDYPRHRKNSSHRSLSLFARHKAGCAGHRRRGYARLIPCRTLPPLRDAPLIARWRKSGCVSERRGERAGRTEANGNSDIGHRGGGLREQKLRVLHATLGVKPVGRNAERFLERAA